MEISLEQVQLLGSTMVILGFLIVSVAARGIKRDWLQLIVLLIGLLLTGIGGTLMGYTKGIQSVLVK